MKSPKTHLFICTSCTYSCNGRESDPADAAALRKNLKNRAREVFPKDEVRVSAVECLGECENGIAAVLYPDGEWFLNLRPESEDELFTKLSEHAARLKK